MGITKHSRYKIGDWNTKAEDSWWAWIYVGGDRDVSETVCREVCFPQGLCVTIEEVKYVFGGGVEDGVRIGLIQYPPFPETIESLREKAISLGIKLAEANFQFSFTIVTPEDNIFYSRRQK